MIEVFRYLALPLATLVVVTLTPSSLIAADKPKKPLTAQQTEPQTTDQEPSKRSLDLNERGIAAMRSKDLKGAEDLFKKSLADDPGNLTAVFNLAGVHLAQKQHDDAITLIKSYTDRGVEDPGLYSRLGDAYFASRKVKEAKSAYEAAYRIAPAYEGLTAKLSSIYGLENRMDLAQKMMEEAVAQSPKDPQNLVSLANIYISNKKYEQAISSAKRALQIKATKEAYLSLGTAYEMTKDYKNSVIAFEKAVQLGDNRAPLAEKIKVMKEKMAS